MQHPRTGPGHLVIIGGGERPAEMMQRSIALAGGSKSRLVIFPTASAAPQEVGASQQREFLAYGAGQVDVLHCSASDADRRENLDLLRQATGVFFSGGDQRLLTAALLGTRLLAEIRAVYERGGVIAGTSAGAAVMSQVMITGDEGSESNPPLPSSSIRRGSVGTAPGFGFVTRAIIDQHFLKRSRHNRLLSLVLERPHLTGVGIDEATAIVVRGDDTFEVIGESSVLIYDASAARSVGASGGRLSGSNLQVHILSHGDRYCLRRREVFRPAHLHLHEMSPH